jgi:threonine/homoserine/homoserine lactone efflux protein
MTTLAPVVVGLGLAVAFTSPGSVVTMIVLLSMSVGLRRGVAFIVGWLLALFVLALLLVFVLQGKDFSSPHTTPSRAVSGVELVLGALLLVGSWRVYRRPRERKGPESPPTWLDAIDRTHWLVAVAVGAMMLSYTLSLAAGAEILKANVSTVDASAAALLFAITSIVTIAAPVVVVVAAPERSTDVLASWKAWLLAHSRSIALIALMVVGALLIARAAYDLGSAG